MRAIFHQAPARIETTKVQTAVGKALVAVQKLNAPIPAYQTTAPSVAAAVLGECEVAMVEAAACFGDARRLVESGEPILPPEVEARS